MPNIVDRGIFKEYSRTPDEQKLYDLENKVNEQAQLIDKLLAIVEESNKNGDVE